MFGYKLFTIVREKTVVIVEQLGKYNRTLQPGLNFLIPLIDRAAYTQSLKEEILPIEKQQVITKDNVAIHLDGIAFIRIIDPFKASYQVSEPQNAIKLLCQTILRSEIGKLKLDQLLQERAALNRALQSGLSKAAAEWGYTSLGVEILQIEIPEEIRVSMQAQVVAERNKRREILESEGKQISEINIATGAKTAAIKIAEGDAEAVRLVSQNEAKALTQISEALQEQSKKRVLDYILLQHYLKGYSSILKSSKVVVVPKAKEGQGNDFMSLAAMMMFNNQNSPVQKIIEIPSKPSDGISNSSVSQSEISKLTQDQLDNLIKKNVYYNDPRLYSDDEEKRIN
ncbi:unnamed protein product [Paramecium octaurelia]|uniref:Band 7 domain-containing protein n=1 Tax=Paramecium octaurelia TaxID=43137 RepID=A0A8S1VZJ7_PAROT|nr:unnamed protein product [Paramecium octaurelia]